MDNPRPNWNDYFMDIAREVKKRSTCLRRQVGAVLVRDKRILSTGYNGAPSGVKHCLDIGCMREKLNVPSGEKHELCRALHAEENCIIQCARYGIEADGGIIYTTTYPCSKCIKMIINAGVRKVICDGANPYPDPLTQELTSEAEVQIMTIL